MVEKNVYTYTHLFIYQPAIVNALRDLTVVIWNT